MRQRDENLAVPPNDLAWLSENTMQGKRVRKNGLNGSVYAIELSFDRPYFVGWKGGTFTWEVRADFQVVY
jgi:hypothetical protein